MCGCCGDDEAKDEPVRPKNPLKQPVCCTDIIFLIVFIAFWAGMVWITVFAVMNGDGYRLIYGYDSFGNTCNRNNSAVINLTLSGWDTRGLSNVFFMDMLDPFDSMEVCVKTCPGEYLRTAADVKAFAKDNGSYLCSYNIPLDQYDDTALYRREGPCPELPVYPQTSLLNRCIPNPSKLLPGDRNDNTTGPIISFLNSPAEFFRECLADLYSSWKQMLVLCVIALVLSGLMILLIRYLASIIVWVIVGLSVVGSLVGTALLWWQYYVIKKDLERAEQSFDIPILSIDISNKDAFLGFSITATVFTVILLLLLLVMRKRIKLVVALFHEAGKCLAATPLLLLQPLWTFLILIVFLAFWLVVFAFVSTSGNPEIHTKDGFDKVVWSHDVEGKVYWWYCIVCLIWTSEFILACQQMVISGAVATWFFTRNKKELSCVVGKATSRLILHHIGSVAFGSFIITLVKLPRLILMYIHSKCKGSENACAKCCLKCCICCLWCLEKCLKFLNQNAYTVIIIEGKSFCPAAMSAFKIIASNVLRVAAINSVGDFVLFLGKIAVTGLTCAISVLWLQGFEGPKYFMVIFMVCLAAFCIAHAGLTIYEGLGLRYYAVPVALVTVLGFLIAHCFLTIYEMVIDTLLLCFCEDMKLNDGSSERPYYMSDSLMAVVQEVNAGLDPDDVDIHENKAMLHQAQAPVIYSTLQEEPCNALQGPLMH